MPLQTNIHRRRWTYYFRTRVPSDLVEIMGKTELRHTLGTGNPQIARVRGAEALRLAPRLFDGIRRLVSAEPDRARHEVAKLMEHYRQDVQASVAEERPILRGEGAWLLHRASAPATIHGDSQIDEREAPAQDLIQSFARSLAASFTAELARRSSPGEENQEGAFLAALLSRIKSETQPVASLSSEALEPDGNPEFESRAGIRTNDTDPVVPSLVSRRTVLDAKGDFYAEWSHLRKNPKTFADYENTFDAFAYLFGTRPIGTIRKADVVAFKDHLLKLPISYRTTLGTNDPIEAITLNAARKQPLRTLNPGTINAKYLSNLRCFFGWAATNGHIRVDPAKDVSAKQPPRSAATERKPFSIGELQRIFDAPLFTGCASAARPHDPGSHRIRDHRFWAPLVCLFAGLRLSEAGQLAVDDVVSHNDAPHFSMRLESEFADREARHIAGEAKRLKTDAATRFVPVHHELVALGFFDYVEARRAGGDRRIFPEWIVGSDGYYSSVFGKFFNERFLVRIGIKRPDICAHSFRHCFKDALRDARLDPETQDRLLGHSNGSVQERYGSGSLVLAQSQDFQRIGYPGLDLARLKT